MTVRAIANLMLMLAEYACFVITMVLTRYAVNHDLGSLALGIWIMSTYGQMLLQYIFSIQGAYLTKQILIEKRPAFTKGARIIPVYIIGFLISFIFWSASWAVLAYL